MDSIIYAKVLFCLVVLLVVLYLYFNTRKLGCLDKTAINYNPNANLHQIDSCIYPNLGCTDPNAVNYNKWANVSCSEDCINSKGSNCTFTQSCATTTEHICKYNISGCSRPWINNATDATTDDNSCLTNNEFMNRIVILSGGSCTDCTNEIYVKIDDNYVVEGGDNGLHLIILDRKLNDNQIIVKHIKHFPTGESEEASADFVTFVNINLYPTDIAIIVAKGDMIGQYGSGKNYLRQVISTEAQQLMKKIGGRHVETTPKGSYILIGTIMLDIYYESTNPNRDSYFPLFNLIRIGCINVYDKKFIKSRLSSDKHKMLSKINPYRCALEAYSMGVDVFTIKNETDCYVVTDSNITTYDNINKFNKTVYVRSYLLNNYIAFDNANSLAAANVSNSLNCSNSEEYYVILDAYTSSYFLNDFGKLYTYIYSGAAFAGLEVPLEEGLQSAIKIFSGRDSAVANGGFETLQINSLRVPAHFYTVAFKTFYTDSTLNDPNIPEYKLFSGPSATDLSKQLHYKKYPDVQKEKYVPTISSLLTVNGYGSVLIFEKANYDGLVLKLSYGKHILNSTYTKPYMWKIKYIVSHIINDLNIKKIFTDKDDNDITYQTIIKMFQNNLPFTTEQFRSSLIALLSMAGSNYDRPIIESYVDKCLKLIIGFPIGSIRSYIKPFTCIRFFDTIDCKNLLYTFKTNRSFSKPYYENNDLTTNVTAVCNAIIVDKIGWINIMNGQHDPLHYKNLSYNEIDKTAVNIQSFPEDTPPLDIPYNKWNDNIGIAITKDASIIKLIAVNANNTELNEVYYINKYKNLYHHIKEAMFNLTNFIYDDATPFLSIYYDNQLISSLEIYTKRGKHILQVIDNKILLEDDINMIYFPKSKQNKKTIFVAQIQITSELYFRDLFNTSLKEYNINFSFALIEFPESGKYIYINNNKYYNGLVDVPIDLLPLVNNNRINIYNLSVSAETHYTNTLDNNLIIGGIMMYDNDKNFTRHIPIIKNKFYHGGQMYNITYLKKYLNYNDVHLSYYNLTDKMNRNLVGDFITNATIKPITNINQIVALKNKLNALTVPMICEIHYSEGISQQHVFVNEQSNILFSSGLYMLSVSAGHWKISFNHHSFIPTRTTTLYIPGPATHNKYQKSSSDGIIISNYINDTIVEVVNIKDVLLSADYAHIINVNKKWKEGVADVVYVEYHYETSRWLIKMPYNLPTVSVSWERYYG
jgi:hypothetical protein